MLVSMARLHSVDIDSVGLTTYGINRATSPPQDFVPYILRQIKTWTTQYRRTETEPIPEMEYLIETLPLKIPSNAEKISRIVHGNRVIDSI